MPSFTFFVGGMSISAHRLFALAEGLAGAEAEAFHSLFRATVTKSAPMVLPPAFVPKIQRWFNPDGRREPADVVVSGGHLPLASLLTGGGWRRARPRCANKSA